MNNGSVKKINELSSSVQDYLLALATETAAEKAAEKFSLARGASEIFLGLLDDVATGKIAMKDLPEQMAGRFKDQKDKTQALAVEFAGRLLLPIAQEIGDVAGQIKVWGGDPEKFSKTNEALGAPVAPEAPKNLVAETLAELEIQLNDPLLEKRLIFILDSYLNSQRSEDETKAALARSPKVGGMDLSEEEAGQLLAAFKDKRIVQPKTMIDIKKPEPAVSVIPPIASVVSTPPPPPPVAPAVSSVSPLPPPHPSINHPLSPTLPQGGRENRDDDEKDIAQAAAVVKEKIFPAAKPVASAEEAVKRIETETGLKLDENGRKKFLTAVEARLKEARDAFETRDALERPVEQGGFGIRGVLLAKVMEALEKIVGEWQASMMVGVNQARQTAREAKAAEEINKKQVALAAARAGRPKVALRPAALVMSPASQTVSAARPVMADVVAPARKLSGPIDELARLTPDEFRRLSRDPKEAAIKIKDKIGLLEEQGVGQKILGVKAWRNSPISRLYLEINREALLSGRTVGDVSSERAGNGQASLSTEEIKVINELNGELRF